MNERSVRLSQPISVCGHGPYVLRNDGLVMSDSSCIDHCQKGEVVSKAVRRGAARTSERPRGRSRASRTFKSCRPDQPMQLVSLAGVLTSRPDRSTTFLIFYAMTSPLKVSDFPMNAADREFSSEGKRERPNLCPQAECE